MNPCQSFEPLIPIVVSLWVFDVPLHLLDLFHELASFLAIILLAIPLWVQRICFCLVDRRSRLHARASSIPALWPTRLERWEFPVIVFSNGIFARYGPELKGSAIHHLLPPSCTFNRAPIRLPTELHVFVRGKRHLILWGRTQVLKLWGVDWEVHRHQSGAALDMLCSDLLEVTRRVGTEVHRIYEYNDAQGGARRSKQD